MNKCNKYFCRSNYPQQAFDSIKFQLPFSISHLDFFYGKPGGLFGLLFLGFFLKQFKQDLNLPATLPISP